MDRQEAIEALQEIIDGNWQCDVSVSALEYAIKCLSAEEKVYTREMKVERTPFNGPAGLYFHLSEYDGFKLGDNVIVQIRKKDYNDTQNT